MYTEKQAKHYRPSHDDSSTFLPMDIDGEIMGEGKWVLFTDIQSNINNIHPLLQYLRLSFGSITNYVQISEFALQSFLFDCLYAA